ncbi:hypothetical protein LXM60_16575 [Pandoraea sputorum]|nr:hypothetical protein [Pandoraea sputorum]MCE4061816.1 hypothetical protein [Pandoraea sputorum]
MDNISGAQVSQYPRMDVGIFSAYLHYFQGFFWLIRLPLVQVDEFDHVDPHGICDINEFGQIEPVLARFVSENECLRFSKEGGKLFCCQTFRLPECDESFGEGVDATLVMREEVHEVRSLCIEISPSQGLTLLRNVGPKREAMGAASSDSPKPASLKRFDLHSCM